MPRALDEFQARLLDLEADLTFVSVAARLRPRLGDVVNWDAGADATTLARDFMRAKGSRVEGLFGALLVRTLAALERYTRILIEEALAVSAGRAPKYDQLASHIRTRNTALTGALLQTVESPRGHLTVNFDALVSNLASCQPGSTAYSLNAKAFAAVVAGAGPPTIEKALANVGVRDWWDKVGADGAMARLLGTRGARATGAKARDKLEELWRWRNQVAHGGDGEIALTEIQLRECIAVVRAFAIALDSVVLQANAA